MIAVCAAFINKSLIYGYMMTVIAVLCIRNLRRSKLFRAARSKNQPKVLGTANQFRKFVEVINETVFKYLFLDPAGINKTHGFGFYMNIYKVFEMAG